LNELLCPIRIEVLLAGEPEIRINLFARESIKAVVGFEGIYESNKRRVVF